MFEVFFKLWYMVAILPFLMLLDGYEKFKRFMNDRKLWWALPYFLIVLLLVVFAVLWSAGYRK